MKLTVLEFRRILARKWVFAWFFLLLGLGLWCSALWTDRQFENVGVDPKRYLELARQYEKMPVLQVKEQTAGRIQKLERILPLYLNYTQGLLSEEELMRSLAEAGYSWDAPSQVDIGQINSDRVVLRRICQDAEAAAGYGDWLLNLQQGNSELSGISLFEDDPYVALVRKKAMRDYAGLKEIPEEWYPNIPISVFLRNRVMEGFCALFLLTVVMLLFTDEKEKGYSELTGTTVRGRGRFWFSKTTVVLLCATAATTIYEGAFLWYLLRRMGSPAWNAPIQMAAGFMPCRWNLTALQAVLLTLVFKCILLYLLALLLCAAACAMKKNLYLLTGVAFVCLLSAFSLRGSGSNGLAGWLFCLNPLLFSDSASLLLTYQVVSFFGHPVDSIRIVAAASLCVLLFATPAGYGLYGKVPRQKRLPRFCVRRRRPSEKPRKPPRDGSGFLTVLELKKLLLSGKLIYPLLGVTVLSGWYYLSAPDIHLTTQELYYREYMKQLNGPLTEEKELFLEEERTFFAQVDTLLEALREEENPILRSYLETLLTRQAAFEQVEAQYRRVRDNSGVFLYETGYLYLLGPNQDARSNAGVLAAAIFLTVFLPCFSWTEYKKGAYMLVNTTPRGRHRLTRTRFFVYFLMTAVPASALYAGDTVRILRQFGGYGIFQGMENLEMFAEHFQGWFLWEALALTWILRFLGIALAILISTRAMAFFRDYLKTVLFSGIVILLPCVLRLLGFSFLKGYFMNALLWGSELLVFQIRGNLSAIFIVLLQCAALVAVCGIYERKTRTAGT